MKKKFHTESKIYRNSSEDVNGMGIGKKWFPAKGIRESLDLDNVANVTLFIAVFIGIWQIVFLLNVWPKVALPSPAMVSGTFEELIQNMTLIYGIAVTMYRLVIGFSISIHHWYWNWIGHGKILGFWKNHEFVCSWTAIFSECGMGTICNSVNWIK